MRKESGFFINAGPTMMVLAILRDGTRTGYHLAQELKLRSNGRLQFQQSTMYALLNRLQKDGVIQSAWDISDDKSARRLYSLTDKGRGEAAKQISDWEHYAAAVADVIKSRAQ